MGVLLCSPSLERSPQVSRHLLRVPFASWNVLRICLVFCPIFLFLVARTSNSHCWSPLHPEVKFSSEVFLVNSWEEKMGVKLEGRGSVLIPSRPVPLIFPITQEAWWRYEAAGMFQLCPPLTLTGYGSVGEGVAWELVGTE